MSNRIPIRNLYYLLCYAWDKLEVRGVAPAFVDGQRDVTNLMARILAGASSYVVRRGIDRVFGEQSELLTSIRGRIDVGGTVARTGGLAGRAFCRYEELGPNVLHNQIMKAALKRILRTKDVAAENRHEATAVLQKLREISDIKLTLPLLSRVQLYRNNAYYGVMLDACELLLTNSLPTTDGDGYRLHEFAGAPRDMANLFERFVVNFYKREQTEFSVQPKSLGWNNLAGSVADRSYLPTMRTDLFLRSQRKAIVIDCKFYEDALKVGPRNEHLRMDHLKQISIYAERLREELPSHVLLEGMLLYPVVSRDIAPDYEAKGYQLKIRFINLNQEWKQIHRDLLKIVGIYNDDLAEPIGSRLKRSSGISQASPRASSRTPR